MTLDKLAGALKDGSPPEFACEVIDADAE